MNRSSLAAAAIALGLIVTTAGCDALSDGFQEGLDRAVEEAVEHDLADLENAEYESDQNQVLDSFPSEVPVPGATLIRSSRLGDTFTLDYELSSMDQLWAYASALEAAGFEEAANDEIPQQDGGTSRLLKYRGTYNVTVMAMELPDAPPSLLITVYPNPA